MNQALQTVQCVIALTMTMAELNSCAIISFRTFSVATNTMKTNDKREHIMAGPEFMRLLILCSHTVLACRVESELEMGPL